MKKLLTLGLFSALAFGQRLSNGVDLNTLTVPASTVYLSKIPGVNPNCNVRTGLNATATACADNGTSAVNAVLATATAVAPIDLIVDKGFGTSGLNLGTAGHVTVHCLAGAGLFVVSGSNSPAIYTGMQGQPANGSGSPPAQGSDVEVSGCYIHGNRGSTAYSTGTGGNSSGSDPHGNGYWIFGIHISNMQNVLISGNTFFDIPTYATAFDNVSHGVFEKNTVLTKSFIYNQDGIHLNGPWLDIKVRGNYYDMGDDAVAGNCAEGYGVGPCSGLIVSDENWANVWNGARLYASLGAGTSVMMDDSQFSNIVGHARNAILKLGGENPDSVVTNQLGTVTLSNISMTSDNQPFIVWESTKLLKLNGVDLKNSTSSALFDVHMGDIQQLDIVSLNPGNIGTVADTRYGYTGTPINAIHAVTGPGVAGTGLQFPDALMGNNSFYLSAGSSACQVGALCFRSNGSSQQVLGAGALPGPVLKWLFTEGSSPAANTGSGAANNMTLSGMTFVSQTGVAHTVPSSDGSTSWSQAASVGPVDFGGSTPFTVSTWKRFTSTTSGFGAIFSTLGGANNAGFELGNLGSSNILSVFLSNNFAGNILIHKDFTVSGLNTTTWYNFVVTYNGSRLASGVRLYVNGVEDTTANVVTDALGTNNASSGLAPALSTRPNQDVKLGGPIGDTRVWARELGSSEASAIYSAGAQ